MLIASPQIIANYLKRILEGYAADVKKIRVDLASEFGAEYTCPVTTGIFLRIVAEFANEQFNAGKSAKEVPPFWHAIDQKSNTIKELSDDKILIIYQRLAEGLPA